MSKGFAAGISIGVAVPLLYSLIKAMVGDENDGRKIDKKKFVGIELGGTNYNVAIGEPILNNKGQITDFLIIKRKNGITYNDPKEALAEIIRFMQENQTQSVVSQKEELEKY